MSGRERKRAHIPDRAGDVEAAPEQKRARIEQIIPDPAPGLCLRVQCYRLCRLLADLQTLW